MDNFTNRSYYGISLITGIIFIAFSFMVQSWMLAITTLIFIAVQTLTKKAVEARQEVKAKAAVRAMEEGKEREETESVIEVKIPFDFIFLLGFVVLAFVELIIIVFVSF